ncbi:MAG TPA: tRNA preQ1(34) S-adenosylmethionine ribosyltransferase-isomerase QueA [bacterium]|nr:tRNA preQ1(34) S-adenosylmethionine ribosyltransferase-isomerase QueA [bacterium]HPT29352.1 tRNA preQ1(34) S-adenosylmethionine ribosyltransferase-isomerase QueA [bacterium]
MRLSDFDYNLPKNLIAQQPTTPRDHSRLLVLDKTSGDLSDRHFYDLPDYLVSGDVLVINNSKVFPARLFAHKVQSGGRVEIFLLKREDLKRKEVWQCLVGGKIKTGLKLDLTLGLEAQALQDNDDGTWQIEFNITGRKFMNLVFRLGQMPLPPYIKREKKEKIDEVYYQTVYAKDKQVGSVAAPTAGLHFTKKLLAQLKAKGVIILPVTLHVGLGTFAGVKTENIKEHKMHSEYWEIGKTTARQIVKAKAEKRRVIAVGTTACRVLETWGREMKPQEASGWTDIFIYPGYEFKVVDALITNFHLPQSTLLMLVSALAGKKLINLAYQKAISLGYHFFSYGDAMFIH